MATKTVSYQSIDVSHIRNQRHFAGVNLSEIALPIGGIGTGTISVGGRGNLRDFEINNHPDKGNLIPFSLFALWAKADGQKPVARILEGQIPPPYRAAGGESPDQMVGVPRFAQATFTGRYPVATVELADPTVPVTATLNAWNPFIPLNVHDSALPVAIFEWTFANDGDVPVEISLASSMMNPLTVRNERGHDDRKGSLNEYKGAQDVSGVSMNHPGQDPNDPTYGSLAIASPWSDKTVVNRWYRAGWFDKSHLFWDEFALTGRVAELTDSSPSTNGDVASVILHATVPARESVTLPVYVTWHFPKASNPWTEGDPNLPQVLDTYVGASFANAWEVAEYVGAHIGALREGTQAYLDTIFGASLPDAVTEAITSQASIMRTNTCFLLADGRFFGWEGTWDKKGSCHGSCTHVWNYEQAVAFLFPQLERTMRETEFLHNTYDTGNMTFRTQLPPGAKHWHMRPCADGQMGTIIQVYRDWKLSGDDAFLKTLWPKVKQALEYAWTATPETISDGVPRTGPEDRGIDSVWDLDKDGLMEGEQHNTYDIEFYGPNTMCTALYLGALRACEELATYLGESDKAAEYRAVYESGRAKVDAELWNGEYYIQQVDVIPEVIVPDFLRSPGGPTGGTVAELSGNAFYPKYQYGEGCLSDQLLGQWAAHVVGLGYLLDETKVAEAVRSIYRYNFREQVGDDTNVQRVYALNDEPGLLLCSWPHGNRPALPFVYSDEVWTGIEYHVAAHLIYEGAISEGLAIVEAVSKRYSGHNRNPWNQIECGYHYARAMSSWSVKLALDGFTFSVPEKRLGFAPKVNGNDYRTFWSTGTGWGEYRQIVGNGEFTLKVKHGTQAIQRLDLADLPSGPLSVTGPSRPVAAYRDGQSLILSAPLTLSAGESLEIVVGS